MTSLDPRSLIVMGGFMALVMAVVLGFMRRYYPPSIRGLAQWALAPVVWLSSTGFLSAPGLLPRELDRLLGNVLLLLGFVVFRAGCRLFVGLPVKWLRPLMVIACTTLGMAWFGTVQPSYRMQVAIITIALATTQLDVLVALWRAGRRNFPVLMVQFTLLVQVTMMLVRLQAVLTDPHLVDLMVPTPVQMYYLGANVMAVLLLCIGAVLMATDRVRSELEHTAMHDGLTGTLNRTAIVSECEAEHSRSPRSGDPFALMMIDMDHFKTINDTLGHQQGDKVLVHFAQCTQAALRRADRLGRYGGEEFLVLLPSTTSASALPVAQRIHAVLAAGHALDSQVSIGVTHWNGPGDSVDHMLSRADAALYQAKAKGRNQTCTG